MRTRYDTYDLRPVQWIGGLLAAAVIWGMCSLLLYNSLWPLVCFPVTVPVWLHMFRDFYREKQKRQLLDMFIPAMETFVVALRAGYSAETALSECRQDMQRLAGEKDLMVRELIYMEKQISVSVPVEKLFLDLAERSGLEDIQRFARVFAVGKRTGGDLEKILTATVRHTRQKQETEKDIAAEIASRRMEQNIMSAVPPGILLYLRLSSPEYMAVFYTTTAGRTVMTVCLLLYLAAWFWGRWITAIQV